jgi:hypothetical protein
MSFPRPYHPKGETPNLPERYFTEKAIFPLQNQIYLWSQRKTLSIQITSKNSWCNKGIERHFPESSPIIRVKWGTVLICTRLNLLKMSDFYIKISRKSTLVSALSFFLDWIYPIISHIPFCFQAAELDHCISRAAGSLFRGIHPRTLLER